MTAFVVAVIAALVGVIFWAAVRNSSKRAAQQVLEERDAKPAAEESDPTVPVYRIDGKVYVNGRWVREKK
jgi:hypothetical protein